MKITGKLFKTPVLTGAISQPNVLVGQLTNPAKTLNGIVAIGVQGGEVSYSMLQDKPSINEHQLISGENTLRQIGIGLSTNRAIDRLF